MGEALSEGHFSYDSIIQYWSDLKKILTEELSNFFLIIDPSFAKKLQKKYLKIISVLAKANKKTAYRYMQKKELKLKNYSIKKL